MQIGGRAVACRVVFGKEIRSFVGATVYVRLQDVTRADAVARVVAEETLHDVSGRPGDQLEVSVQFGGQPLDERASYAIRVHVDVDKDGRVSRGDYVSTESYPVLTHGYSDRVTVRVREVT